MDFHSFSGPQEVNGWASVPIPELVVTVWLLGAALFVMPVVAGLWQSVACVKWLRRASGERHFPGACCELVINDTLTFGSRTVTSPMTWGF